MRELKSGVIPETFQPQNANYCIKEMYNRIIKSCNLCIDDYYFFDIQTIIELLSNLKDYFGESFFTETNELFNQLLFSTKGKGDKIPLFLININLHEFFQIYENKNGIIFKEGYYNMNSTWNYYIVKM